MKNFLRITFCLLACLSLGVTIVIFALFGLWGFVPLGGAVVFTALMLLSKNGLPRREKPGPKPDFMNSAEENERIRREQEAKEQADGGTDGAPR